MEELIRDQIHSALEVEAPPAHLRAYVMASLPAANRRTSGPSLQLSGQWAAGLVAAFLALAVIAGLLFSRGLLPFMPARPPVIPPVGLISPEGVAVAPDGSVYVSDFLGDRVFKLKPDGKVAVVAGGGLEGDGPATRAFLNHPSGLAIDRAGNVFVADTPGGSIRRVDAQGVISTLSVRNSTGDSILFTGYAVLGLAFDGTGGLWVSELFGTVRRIDPSGNATVLDTASLPPPGWVPAYMAFDSAGNLYITDGAPGQADNPLYSDPTGGGCRVVKVAPDRELSVIAGTGVCGYSGDGGPAKSAQLGDPDGIAVDAVGNIYFSDARSHRIRRIDTKGIITTVAGTGVAGFSGDGGPAASAQLEFPVGMGITSSGLLYFSDMTCQCWSPSSPGRVRVINLTTGKIATVIDGQTRVIT